MKRIYILLTFSLICLLALAKPYIVTAPHGVKVRLKPGTRGRIVRVAEKGSQVEVDTIIAGWAHLSSACEGDKAEYISARYLEEAPQPEVSVTEEENEGWIYWLNWDYMWEHWRGLIIVVGLFLVIGFGPLVLGLALLIVKSGLYIGLCVLIVGYVMYSQGWLSWETMWRCTLIAVFIGLGLGLLFVVFSLPSIYRNYVDNVIPNRPKQEPAEEKDSYPDEIEVGTTTARRIPNGDYVSPEGYVYRSYDYGQTYTRVEEP